MLVDTLEEPLPSDADEDGLHEFEFVPIFLRVRRRSSGSSLWLPSCCKPRRSQSQNRRKWQLSCKAKVPWMMPQIRLMAVHQITAPEFLSNPTSRSSILQQVHMSSYVSLSAWTSSVCKVKAELSPEELKRRLLEFACVWPDSSKVAQKWDRTPISSAFHPACLSGLRLARG